MRIKPLLTGMATYIPGLSLLRSKHTGGTDSARYCYSVWLRHLLLAQNNGLCSTVPKVVAELGPGDSIGTGLAALLSGADMYFGFDVVEYANDNRNLGIFEELVTLFRNREPIPDQTEFPLVKPRLTDYTFPRHLLTDDLLDRTLNEHRLEKLRASIAKVNGEGACIRYFAPWTDSRIVRQGTVDMIFSQSVLQYVDPLNDTYRTLYKWLSPEGFMSHMIDFKWDSAPVSEWNLHWTCSDFVWKLTKGKRPAYHSRFAFSHHKNMMDAAGLKIIFERSTETPSAIRPEHLSPRFANLSQTDLVTADAFIQAIK